MKEELKEGDVILIADGMNVYGEIPAKYVYANQKFSNELVIHDIKVGLVYKTSADVVKDMNDVTTAIMDLFDSRLGVMIDSQPVVEFVQVNLPSWKPATFMFYEGEFVVTKTVYEGNKNGEYNVNRIFCKRLYKDGTYDERGEEVSFYQSPNFNCCIMPKDLKVYRQLKKNFS